MEEQNSYHINILKEVDKSVKDLIHRSGSREKLENLKRFSNLLLSKLPEKKKDVYFILEQVMLDRDIIINQNRSNYMIEGSDHLFILIQKIRMFFFTDILSICLRDKKDIKITLNNGKKIALITGSYSSGLEGIQGLNPDGESTRISFVNIKLEGGIIPVPKEEVILAGTEFLPS